LGARESAILRAGTVKVNSINLETNSEGYEAMIRKILVATDGSDHAKKAIDYACDLGMKYRAMVYILHVVDKSGITKQLLELIEEHRKVNNVDVLLRQIGERIIGVAKNEVEKKGLKKFHLLLIEGDPAETIIRFARKRNIDVIVMGSRGLGTLEEVFLGSVSHKVCNLADCTCITTK
jgi:nucleotide-binding universal stress UspA family protein